jgi:hypothetical protein
MKVFFLKITIFLYFLFSYSLKAKASDVVVPTYEVSKNSEDTWLSISEKMEAFKKGKIGCNKWFKDTAPLKIIRLSLGTYQIYCFDSKVPKRVISYVEMNNSKSYMIPFEQPKRYMFPDRFMRESGFFSIFR